MNHFFCCCQDSLFFSLFWQFDCTVSKCGPLWVCTASSLWSFLDEEIWCRFPSCLRTLWLFLQISFLPLSFSPFLLGFLSYICIPIICSLYHIICVPQISEALFISLHSFVFLLLRLDHLNWPVFKFTDSPFCQFKSAVSPSVFHF